LFFDDEDGVAGGEIGGVRGTGGCSSSAATGRYTTCVNAAHPLNKVKHREHTHTTGGE
jgi:hypothetical protein